MRKLLCILFALTYFSAQAQLVSDSSTAVNAVGVQDINTFPSNTSVATCADTLTVSIPPGNWVYGVDLYYTINTVGGFTGMPPSGISTYLEFLNTGAKEPQAYAGTSFVFGASENVSRLGLTLANGPQAVGQLDFKLHAFDVAFFSSGCDTADAKIQAGTFKVVVHHAPPPTCFKPSNLGLEYTMHDRARLNWTTGGASAWQISYGAPGFNPASGTLVGTTSNPTTLFGLSPNTNYEYYVRDSCAPGDVSLWEGPFAFRTLCNPVTFTTTYTESFEGSSWTTGTGQFNNNNGIDPCWTRDPQAPGGGVGGGAFVYAWGTGSGTTPTAATGPAGAQNGSQYIFTEASGGANQSVALISSPLIDVTSLSTPALEFYYHRYGAFVGELKAQVWSQSTGWQDVVTISGPENQSSSGAAWILESVPLSNFSNDTIRVRFRAVKSFQAQGDIAIDAVEIKEAPNCPKPTNLSVSGLSQTSVDLSWVSANASTWQVEYGLQGFTTGSGTKVVVNSNPATVSGLTGGSIYDFYVRSICAAGDSSAWAGPVSAMPYCAAVNAPYTENFDGAGWTSGTGAYNTGDALAPCWFRNPGGGLSATSPTFWGVRNTAGTTPTTGPDLDFSGTGNFVYLESSAGSVGQAAHLESPFINLSTLSIPELRFQYHMYGSAMGTLVVDIYRGSTGTWTPNLWSISGQQQSAGSDPWLEAIVDISAYAGDSIIIRFRGIKGNERWGDMAVDEVQVDEQPACPQPSNLGSSNITATTVDIDWTSGGASNWQISSGPVGFNPNTGSIVGTSNNPHTLTLAPSQVYEIYVRDSCGLGSVSAWAGPILVSMPCGIANLPWSENFDGGAWTPGGGGLNTGNLISACWSRPSVQNPNFGTNSGPTGSAFTGPNSDVSGNGNYLYTEASSGGNGPGSITTPQIILTANVANPTLKFYYHMYGGDIDSLYVEIDNGSGWTWIFGVQGQQQTGNGDPWTLVQQSLQSYSGDTVQIRFTGVNNGFAGDIAIDEVAIEDIACPQSSNFIFTANTSSSITLDWTSAGAAGFILEYGPSGFSPGSGTQVSVSTAPYTVGGLMSGTLYDFYLRDSCGATSFGPRLGPVTAPTLCSSFTAPYTESFDDSTWVVGVAVNNNIGNQLNPCWTRPSDQNPNFGPFTGATPSAGTGPTADASGAGKYLYTEYSGGVTGPGQVSSPEIYIPASFSNPQLQFAYHMVGQGIDSLMVEVVQGASATQVGSLVGAQQANVGDAWLTEDIDLSAFAGDTVVIRFSAYSSNFLGDIAIDDFAVLDETCPKPTGLVSTANTGNSVTLSWTTGGASNWQIEYGPVGFTQGNGTLVNANTNPFTVTGLNASSYYDFYLRDSCGASDLSLWVGPLLAPTACDTVMAPYTENFDIGFNPGQNSGTAQNFGSTISPCWTRDSDTNYFWGGGNGATPTAGTGPFGDHTSGNGSYVFVESSFAPGGSTAWIESPVINLDSLNFPEMRFWYNMWAQNGSMGDLFWEIDSGTGTWIQLGTYSGNQGFGWQEEVVDLRAYAGATVKVRFRAVKSSGATAQQGDMAIDDFVIQEGPSCLDPDSLLLTARTQTSLSLSWISGGASAWQISYQPVGGGSTTIVGSSSIPTTISGLNPSTLYQVCVRDSCGPGDVGNWVCGNFQTLCTPFTAPYQEDFDGLTWVAGTGGVNAGNDIDACWTRPAGNPNFGPRNGPTASANTGPSGDATGGNYLYTEYSGANDPYGEISSPLIILPTTLNNPELSFAYHLFGNTIDSLTVLLSSGGSTSSIWSQVGQIQSASTDSFQYAHVDLSAWSGDTIQLVFRGYGSTFTADMAIDDVSIETVSCPVPSGLSSTASTQTSISLSWTSNSGNVQIEYGTAGFSPGSGTLVNVSGNSTTINGLSSGLYYDFYLRDSCGANDLSAWLGPLQVPTACGTYLAPYYENFDQGFNMGAADGLNTGASISSCWSRNRSNGFFWGGGTGATPSAGTGPNGDYTSGSGSYVYTEASGGAVGDSAILSTGDIDLSALSNPELSFWTHILSNTSNPNLAWEIYSNGAWLSLGSLSGSQGNAWLRQSADLSAYSGQTVRFRFISVKPGGGSVFQNDVALDDLRVDEAAPCTVAVMPYLENFDGSNWSTGTGGQNLNDQIDYCWTRPVNNQMAWTVGNGPTASANTGPNGDLSGSGNYLYTEASRGAAQATITSPQIYIDANASLPYLYFHYHMYGATITNLSVEVNDGSNWVLLRTHLGQQQTSSNAAWLPDSIDLSAYIGDTISIRFVGDGSSFTSDMAIDEIRVEEALLPCDDPVNLSIANITQTSFDLSWTSTNAPGSSILTWYDLSQGPGTMQVVSGLSSPYTLSNLLPGSDYAISVYDSCSAGRFSANLFDTITTLPCDTVTAAYLTNNSYLGVSFDGNSSINADSLYWDFGNGSGAPGFNVNEVYAAAGTYNVTLRAFNDCGTGDTISFPLLVCDTLRPNIQITTYTDSIGFNASGSNASGFLWDFGDGNTDTNRIGTHVYALSGSYTVSLQVYNDCGDTVSAQQNINICAAPKADWTYSILTPVNSGMRIQFDASASLNATSYSWDFGDGNTGTGVNPIHIYQTPGLFYFVELTVTNSCGNQDDWGFNLFAIGQEEQSLKPLLQAYPNPVQERMILEWDAEQISIHQARLEDMSGRVLLELKLENSGRHELSLQSLAKGNYWLRIESSLGQQNIRVVKK